MADHIVPIRTYLIVYFLLMMLLLATIAASHIPTHGFNLVIALTIAIIKAVLVVLFFMHLKGSRGLVWVVAVASLLWLGILLALTMNDYVSRGLS
jgi:cytochrome c oxidase subunit 4